MCYGPDSFEVGGMKGFLRHLRKSARNVGCDLHGHDRFRVGLGLSAKGAESRASSEKCCKGSNAGNRTAGQSLLVFSCIFQQQCSATMCKYDY